ncbi:MAG: hypothetical protein AB1758_22105, partial [Candidatus Eremiobacterota bacterium]
MSGSERGWTLLEVLVAGSLGLLLLGVSVGFLVPAARVAAREGTRAEMQERAAMILHKITRDLQSSSGAGITLRNASPGAAL